VSRLPDLESLIQPISDSQPAGEYLVYDPIYLKIAHARSSSPDSAGKTRDPDWKNVVKYGVKALQERTKDLQIAAYVTEALGWLDGLDGLRQGFELFRALQETFWESAHPAIEGQDYGARLAPYEFVEDELPKVLFIAIPLTAAPLVENYYLQQFAPDNQSLPHRESRDDAIRRTNPSFHQRLAADLAACRAAYDAWKESAFRQVKKSNSRAPSLQSVTAALDKLDWCLRTIETIRPFMVALVPEDVTRSGAEAVEEMASAWDGNSIGLMEQIEPRARDDGEAGVKRRLTPTDPGADGAGTTDKAQPEVAEAARDLADAGRIDAAIDLLDRARQSARCRRDRFLRQLELVEICLHGDLAGVARPLLDELAAELDARKLDEWEDPALCARVLGAWLVCLRSSQSDEDAGQIPGIFERLCRLDPRSALRHSNGVGGKFP
jgi:type VI secretion system protein ImpA